MIEYFSLPIGVYSEEAQEARNKDFKRVREHNTRKISRTATNEDILHNFLVSSDPIISNLRHIKPKEHSDIPKDVQKLLKNI